MRTLRLPALKTVENKSGTNKHSDDSKKVDLNVCRTRAQSYDTDSSEQSNCSRTAALVNLLAEIMNIRHTSVYVKTERLERWGVLFSYMV